MTPPEQTDIQNIPGSPIAGCDGLSVDVGHEEVRRARANARAIRGRQSLMSQSDCPAAPNRVPPRECIRAARDALNKMYSATDGPLEKLWMFMAEALDWQRRALEQIAPSVERADRFRSAVELAITTLEQLTDPDPQRGLLTNVKQQGDEQGIPLTERPTTRCLT